MSLIARMYGQGGLLTLGTRNMWSVQGPASSLNCPAILVLEFRSIENESPIALPWDGARLPPASRGLPGRCQIFKNWQF